VDHPDRNAVTPRRGTDDLGDLDERELLESVVLELRALRRLIGTIFLVSVAFLVLFPVLALVAR
jgi:hypothetical protein